MKYENYHTRMIMRSNCPMGECDNNKMEFGKKYQVGNMQISTWWDGDYCAFFAHRNDFHANQSAIAEFCDEEGFNNNCSGVGSGLVFSN